MDAVLFDLGGVIVDVDLDPARQRWDQTFGAGQMTLDDAFFSSGLKHALDSGALGVSEALERLAERLGEPVDPDAFDRMWCSPLRVRPEMDAIANAVAAAIPTGLLSNTDPIHHAWAERNLRCLSGFRSQTVSYEVRGLKPEHLIYKRALDAMGSQAERTLFVDDLAENVAAARSLGINAVQFHTREAFVAVLRSHQIPLPDVES